MSYLKLGGNQRSANASVGLDAAIFMVTIRGVYFWIYPIPLYDQQSKGGHEVPRPNCSVPQPGCESLHGITTAVRVKCPLESF